MKINTNWHSHTLNPHTFFGYKHNLFMFWHLQETNPKQSDLDYVCSIYELLENKC